MSTALFVVIYSRKTWWVDFEGKAHGPYESRGEAMVEGRQHAQYSAHMGRASEVLVPDDNGRYHVVWSSGTQPHAAAEMTPSAAE